MEYKNIIITTEPGVGIVTINRPDVLNAVNVETIVEIEHAIREFSEKKDVPVIIITGAGKSFVSGSDISRLVKMDALQAREYSAIGQRVLTLIEHTERVTIAAVNGFALGSGCEIAMACDIRVASEKAKFGQPEVKLGLIPGHAGTQRLARLIGLGKAKELIFTGDIIDAQEAFRIGLVNTVVPPETLMDATRAMAQKIIAAGPTAVRVAKTVLNRGSDAPMATAQSYEMEAFSILFSTSEAKEGMTAFLEKRKPRWVPDSNG
ncbi:enoyl-CoA hydratase/isomerase family protein [candidate division WOR-3 bacterium]|nr:enoyl-CoA hydratase/isomerase family protein [candidate division WOR-3 bacterium]